jgi:carbonic anhydrase
MKKLLILCCATMTLLSENRMPNATLDRLLEGNRRFASGQSLHPDRTTERRQETANKQEPFAVILGCSDSRVAPEIIFDQGIGDLFIVRVAGNVVGPLEMDSVEYSAIYLHSSVIIVLGHENCGAVQAVLQGTTKDIEAVADLIQPAAKATVGQKESRVENTIKINVLKMVDKLKESPSLKKLIEQNRLLIVGGYYNFHTGKVEMLSEV